MMDDAPMGGAPVNEPSGVFGSVTLGDDDALMGDAFAGGLMDVDQTDMMGSLFTESEASDDDDVAAARPDASSENSTLQPAEAQTNGPGEGVAKDGLFIPWSSVFSSPSVMDTPVKGGDDSLEQFIQTLEGDRAAVALEREISSDVFNSTDDERTLAARPTDVPAHRVSESSEDVQVFKGHKRRRKSINHIFEESSDEGLDKEQALPDDEEKKIITSMETPDDDDDDDDTSQTPEIDRPSDQLLKIPPEKQTFDDMPKAKRRHVDTTPGKQPLIIKSIESDLSSAPAIKHTTETPITSASVTPSETPGDVMVDELSDATSDTSADHKVLQGSLTVAIPESTLVTPRSYYEPFEPGVPIVKERYAVERLLRAARTACKPGDDFLELTLDDFAVYLDDKKYGVEMRSLHQVVVGSVMSKLYVDGVLSSPTEKLFVRRVPVAALPMGNYTSLDEHTVGDAIWILSPFNSKRNLYYKLGRPAKEYARFHTPFLWVADLAKHVVDYLQTMGEEDKKVSIHDFRSHFKTWLVGKHGDAPVFRSWLAKYPRDDFRVAVIANLSFLHKEAFGVLEEDAYGHIIWEECLDFTRYKETPGKPSRGATTPPRTIVTPYILDCFKHLPFIDQLEAVGFSKATEELRNRVIASRGLEAPHPLDHEAKTASTIAHERIPDIKPGDTISTHRDVDSSNWERQEAKDFDDVDRWFGLVQRVHTNNRTGRRSFDVTWYYRPVDTLCGLMKYPWNNELFLSDHCSCEQFTKIVENEVLGVHDVHFGGTSTTDAEFFCRQTYMSADKKWVSLEQSHKTCEHVRDPDTHPRPEYNLGETVLVHIDRRSEVLEPCEVAALTPVSSKTLNVRRLFRRHMVDPSHPDAPPNELVYSDIITTVRYQAIHGRCHVRFFPPTDTIPTPYDRSGVGAFFYLTHTYTSSTITPLSTAPATMKQGFNPHDQIRQLRGLDLFCGGGNFGRGLEESGAITMRWANDYDRKAIHTYMANTQPPTDMVPFLGSIDTLQDLAMRGDFSPSVPAPGTVDFISGGSPCPGFSRLTNDKTTIQQRKNQSLVAAFASSVDLYRPRYGLLENVPSIVQKKAARSQDVLSQLICAIVGLGYQAQFYLLDASSCGAPQRRTRAILTFAAPGHRLPDVPPQTHAHPPETNSLSVGTLLNGDKVASRTMPSATPFPFINALSATHDLPPLQDAKPAICIPHPDHRLARGITRAVRLAINCIPTHPHGMNFSRAWFGPHPTRPVPGSGTLTRSERDSFFPKSNSTSSLCPVAPVSSAYGRQYPNRLMETVTTSPGPRDAKSGRQIHWEEPRVMSVMEARRAQGFRDHEILLGSPPDQVKIVGNSVSREVSLSLGAVFRAAWEETLSAGLTGV